jgi:hypothetical protein
MKKLYFLISLLIAGSVCHAQIKEGATLLGGNFSAGSSSDKSDGVNRTLKNTNLSFSPSYGRAIRDNLVVGFDLMIGYSSQPLNATDVSQGNTYGAGFFVRKYKSLGSGFSLFGQTRVGVDYQEYQTVNYTTTGAQHSDQRILGVDLVFTPGIAYAVSRRWQLETSFPNLAYISYSHSSSTNKQAGQPDFHDKFDSFGVASSLGLYSFSLGLRYVIGG